MNKNKRDDSSLFLESHLSVSEASRWLLKHQMECSRVSDSNGSINGKICRNHLLAVMANGLPLGTKIGELISDSIGPSSMKDNMEKNKESLKINVDNSDSMVLPNSKKLIFHSKKMQDLIRLVLHVATVDTTVLIEGESGVGKELITDILYSYSDRKNGPFIKINCGAIPSNLLESELFGYEPGAFTGANKKGKAGMFELANGGVLFLDEIGDMPYDLQVKLLRAIQEMEITRLGGTQPIKIDIRIIAGTNMSLEQRMAAGRFRKDLYYRLNVVPLFVPPLRERPEDIQELAKHFLEFYNQKHHCNKCLSPDVLEHFMSYEWPGNIRELENLIERLVVTTLHDTIGISDLSAWSKKTDRSVEVEVEAETELMPLHEALENTERKILQKAFSIHDSTYAVARALGISQPTVVRKSAKYGIVRG